MEDLRDSFRGELWIDLPHRGVYASDASLFQILPLAVACPRDEADVRQLLRYAWEERLPIIPRGVGRGVAGEALGDGIVVDFSRHMTAILEEGDTWIKVQPGIILNQLNQHLQQRGRYFPPDPSHPETTTIGSMVARDAAGAHAPQVGSTRDYVQELECVLADGTPLKAARWSLEDIPHFPSVEQRMLAEQLVGLFQRHQELISRHRPQPLIRQRAGYWIWDVWQQQQLDVPRLLVGSEGTLAVFTAAVLHTLPCPEWRGAALIATASLEQAVGFLVRLQELEVSACDLFDRRLLSLARESRAELQEWIPAEAEAALLVEWNGWSARELEQRRRLLSAVVQTAGAHATLCWSSLDARAVANMWRRLGRVVPLLDRWVESVRPLPFVEDIAVPVAALPEFVQRTHRLLQQYGMTASLYMHALSGQIHLRPFLSARLRTADMQQLLQFTEELYQIVWQLQGTISGEHGTGLARSAYLERQFGPLYAVFRQLKHAFDSRGILNPGKVICDALQPPMQDLRTYPQSPPELYELQLAWTPAELCETAWQCNGCGDCKSLDSSLRMCPFYRVQPAEEASPRAKASVVRLVMQGVLPSEALASAGVQRIAELCFNCKQCQLECPAQVDIPHVAIELKAQHAAQHGLGRAEWFLSRVAAWSPWLCRLAPLLNFAQRQGWFRWWLESWYGVARQRVLPEWTTTPFVNRASTRRLHRLAPTSQRPAIVYFVDHYANFHMPDIAEAFCRLAELAGFDVIVPDEQRRCGMEVLSHGELETTRALAEHNVRVLADYAQQGLPIVCTEPAAVLCLRDEYPRLLNHMDARQVAACTIDAGAWLLKQFHAARLPAPQCPLPWRGVYHLPCHLKAVQGDSAFWQLCSLIPQLSLPRMETGCSGMAGTFGLIARHFATSLQMAQRLDEALHAEGRKLGVSECSSCRLQMSQLATRRVVHPVQLLAWSYGLLPLPTG
ncbi:MAG: oxidoreductase [Planctomycetaceae bacterium]|nr:MAG: oxidoreductase [Planctomycetaceae bacterium]